MPKLSGGSHLRYILSILHILPRVSVKLAMVRAITLFRSGVDRVKATWSKQLTFNPLEIPQDGNHWSTYGSSTAR